MTLSLALDVDGITSIEHHDLYRLVDVRITGLLVGAGYKVTARSYDLSPDGGTVKARITYTQVLPREEIQCPS